MAIEFRIEYMYYSKIRITPVYFVEEELMAMEFDDFLRTIVSEVPHLGKMKALRVTVKDGEVEEIGLSKKYFSL